MCHNSGVRVPSAYWVFLLPFGRPGRRLATDGFCCLALALALLAAFSAALRIPGSRHIGNEDRAWVLTQDHMKQASPGTGLPYRRDKNRSSPWVCWPALVTTTSSPARR
jgi:hypothetical protein